jgi:hypothetical protein
VHAAAAPNRPAGRPRRVAGQAGGRRADPSDLARQVGKVLFRDSCHVHHEAEDPSSRSRS